MKKDKPAVLPDEDSAWHNGYSIVSLIPLRAFVGRLRTEGEAHEGKYVYQFPSERGALKALEQVRV